MAGIRWPPEDTELTFPARGAAQGTAAPGPGPAPADLVSDDDRSVAADSWSIKSDYGSTLDDEQRHVDAAEVLSSCTFRASSDYSSDKEEPDAHEVEPSMLGLQSYWDAAYAEDLANFHERGHSGEVWFGIEVMDAVANWTKSLCTNLSHNQVQNATDDIGVKSGSGLDPQKDLPSWSVLDIGTGNGLLLHELAKQGFSDLTGIDYSEGAIDLACNLAARDGFANIKFMVDDILNTKLVQQFHIVMDKGTLDAIGLHPDGPVKRSRYWETVSKLIAPWGSIGRYFNHIRFVITSCNTPKDELVQEVDNFNQRRANPQDTDQESTETPVFQYVDHVKTCPAAMLGGAEGSRVVTLAFYDVEVDGYIVTSFVTSILYASLP